METNHFFKKQGTQITLKLILIGILILFLLIPKFLILDLVEERQRINETVTNEVSSSWANDQIITGPALVIPYQYVSKDEKGNEVLSNKYRLIIYPEDFQVDGNVETESKHRSIYTVLLYTSTLKATGSFKMPLLEELSIPNANMLYDEASIIMGVGDLKGINNKVDVVWNGNPIAVKPGLQGLSFVSAQIGESSRSDNSSDYNTNSLLRNIQTGLFARVDIDTSGKAMDFSFNLDIKGSGSLWFSALGKNTTVHLASTFPDPSFVGEYLPSHTTTDNGFVADWNVLEYNKTLPPYQVGVDKVDMGVSVFGIRIKEPVDNYTKTYRAGKYMILFIALTFLVVFLTELINNLRIHIFQYLLIGLSLAIFFTLLLSISEFLGFDLAYIIAAIGTISVIYLYSLGMFSNRRSSHILLTLLMTLFGYIYLIIQLETSALLVGSIGLFMIIACTMYATRKIKWYEEEAKTMADDMLDNNIDNE